MLAVEHAVDLLHAFELARGHVAALQDGAWRKQLFEGGDDLVLSLLHAEGRNLHHKNVLVFVHDQAAKEIALGIDDAKRGRVGQVALPHCQGTLDALLEERLVHLDTIGRKQADVNPRFGVEEAHAQQPLAVILDLDELAVCGRCGNAKD